MAEQERLAVLGLTAASSVQKELAGMFGWPPKIV
jgi:hypothetical protein